VRNAVKVLADIGEPRMIPSLVGLLGHPEARVRREVVQALGSTPSPKALDGVMKALEDGDEGVRLRAIEALQTLGGASARERIRLLAFRPAPRDAAVRVKAIKALAAVGMEEEVPLLEALLVRRGLFAKAETEDIRRGAVQALGGILERTGSPRALQLLRGVGETDPVAEVRKLALDLLAPSPTRTGGRG
jgi:HEAT repeat protein